MNLSLTSVFILFIVVFLKYNTFDILKKLLDNYIEKKINIKS